MRASSGEQGRGVVAWATTGVSCSRRLLQTSATAQRSEILDDNRVLSDLEEAASFESSEVLVHALARAADHRSEIALREAEVEHERAIHLVPPSLSGVDEQLRDPTLEVEEHEVGSLDGQASEQRPARAQERLVDTPITFRETEDRARREREEPDSFKASADADRGPSSNNATSPRVSGLRTVVRTISSPCAEVTKTFRTAPSTTTKKESPCSPWWKIGACRLYVRSCPSAAITVSAVGSSPAKRRVRAMRATAAPGSTRRVYVAVVRVTVP